MVEATRLSISPQSYDFGRLYSGTTAAQDFTVTNEGTQPVSVTLALAGLAASDFTLKSACPMIAAAASCTVTVSANPKTAGTKVASLTASTTDGGSSTASLSAAVLDTFSVTPERLDFGPQPVGQLSRSLALTMVNAAGAAPVSLSIALSGPNAAEFIVQQADTSLAGGQSGALTIAFSPTSKGAKTATLTIAAKDGRQILVPLTATGS
jgi:hypothetical protein